MVSSLPTPLTPTDHCPSISYQATGCPSENKRVQNKAGNNTLSSLFPPVQWGRAGAHTQYLAGEGRWHHFSTMKWLIVPHLAVNFKHREQPNRSLCQQNAKIISTWNVNQKPALFYRQQQNGSYSECSLSEARHSLCNWITFYIR